MENDIVVASSDSHFFRGPAQTGMAFIPPNLMKRLQMLHPETIEHRWNESYVTEKNEKAFGKKELPLDLQNWRMIVDDIDNDGLALRLIATVAEMSAVMQIEDREAVRDYWVAEVHRQLQEFPIFEVSDQFADLYSSVKVMVRDKLTGEIMSREKLQVIYEGMKMDLSKAFEWDRVVNDNTVEKGEQVIYSKFITKDKWLSRIGNICYVAEPTKLPVQGKIGVLKLSLDSEGFRQMADWVKNGKSYDEGEQMDKLTVKKMAFLAYNYQQLMQNKLRTINLN